MAFTAAITDLTKAGTMTAPQPKLRSTASTIPLNIHYAAWAENLKRDCLLSLAHYGMSRLTALEGALCI